jgi:predicted RNase H-related nuclease YkuK (DUF458 family)
MDYTFKSLTNRKTIELIPYLKSKLEENENVSIYIGTDSQNIGKKTSYACVIVLHYGRNGAHVLYTQIKVERIRDRFNKLWKEVEISMEVAEHLDSHGIRAKFIDIDLNPDPMYGSNNVLRAALGFVESKGFIARVKPYAISASYAADRLCKPCKAKTRRTSKT